MVLLIIVRKQTNEVAITNNEIKTFMNDLWGAEGDFIDTPLGRLDSKHRANLVMNYFPRASHQVIILSTDTEVNEEFYGELSPNISHAYKFNYDSTTGSTQPIEEYFWKPRAEATV